jgi:hypothetical protein
MRRRHDPLMRRVPPPPSSPDFAVIAGRALAACWQPVAAWRIASHRVRTGIVIGYVAAGYLLGIAIFAAAG